MSSQIRDPRKPYPTDYMFWPFIWFIPTFVKPNHITVFRFLLTPVVLVFLALEMYAIGVSLFIFGALSDVVDGVLARKRNQVTPWGTFYDPIVDKIFVASIALFIVIPHVPAVLIVSLIILEILLSLFGWYRRYRREAFSANIWGKIKMVLEVIGIASLLVFLWLGISFFYTLFIGALIFAILFAIISLFTRSL